MKPWRKIHRDIFENEDLGVLPGDAFQLYAALIIYADDEGRIKASPAYLRGKAFRYRDDVKTDDVQAWRDQLAAGGFMKLYSVDGEDYAYHHNWTKWQGKRLDRFEPSKLPEPPSMDINNERQPLGNRSATSRQPLGTPEEIREEKKRGGEADKDIKNDNENPVVSDKGKSDGHSAPPPPASRPAPLPARPASSPSPDGSGDREGKSSTTKKEKFPEADILVVAATYCEAKGVQFCNAIARSSYLRSKAVFYDAKDFLALNGGNVDRACQAIKDFAEGYQDEGKSDWNWKYIFQDWSKPVRDGKTWDELRREYELEQSKEEAR